MKLKNEEKWKKLLLYTARLINDVSYPHDRQGLYHRLEVNSSEDKFIMIYNEFSRNV